LLDIFAQKVENMALLYYVVSGR